MSVYIHSKLLVTSLLSLWVSNNSIGQSSSTLDFMKDCQRNIESKEWHFPASVVEYCACMKRAAVGYDSFTGYALSLPSGTGGFVELSLACAEVVDEP